MQGYNPRTGIVRITYTLQYTPKEFAFPKTTTKYYLQQAIGDIISMMKTPLKTLPLLSYRYAKKNEINQISHILQRSTSHPRLQFYHYPKCYHIFRMKIFNTKISSAHQHQLREWNPFINILGGKHNSQHPHCLK